MTDTTPPLPQPEPADHDELLRAAFNQLGEHLSATGHSSDTDAGWADLKATLTGTADEPESSIRRLLTMAGVAVTDLPSPHAAAGTVRRIGIVQQHQATAIGLAAILSDQPDLSVVAIAQTVPQLLEQATDLDLAVVGLRLADGSAPRGNVELLRDMDIPCVVYTSGDWRDLIRSAARAGVLGVALKSDPVERTTAMIRAAASGRQAPTMAWASALDSDQALTDIDLPPRQREVLEHYANGETAAMVAHKLGMSEHTVNDYLSRIRRRYAEVGRPVRTRVDLLREATKDGIIGDFPH
ncbi:response regulator transcription factor [Nocardia sp. XZ_19_369]|uniref:response regulator transcription factor n=1 Tax=Nocardia sp. XZ_19_369 TaxID=2769487 RepID=UPI001E473E0F|nr:response regulator transcription factor [Nocardia sp. XZ_19_369]